MTFQTFTGRDYIKIDIAGSFGNDKLSWDERIAWFDDKEEILHSLVPMAEEPALFYAGIQAWEKAKAGLPSGYPISLDATCSGIQILAALAGDRKAARICNVVDVGHRADAYTSIYQDMVNQLGETAKIDRKLTKRAIMCSFYGSTAQPKEVFGEGVLLSTFYNVVKANAPGAWEINESMLAIWDETKLINEWVLPDNFHVKIKVMGQVNENVQFLNEPFEVTHKVNQPIKGGRSLGANMVHSIDGMIVREMQHRCTFDPTHVNELRRLIEAGAGARSEHREKDQLVKTIWEHFLFSGFLSARILEHLDIDNLGYVEGGIVLKLLNRLPEKPFEVISVHDCFRCLPNYGNDLRRQYNNLLAEIAESDLLSYVISQIIGRRIYVNKLDRWLAIDIRETNYALS